LGPDELALILPQNWQFGTAAFSTFASDAFYGLTEQVPATIDGLHLIQDILTLRKLSRSIIKNFSDLRRVFIRGRNVWGSGHGFNLAEVARNIANWHLTQLFGIQPLIREVKQFGVGLVSLGERLKFLRDTVGEEFTTHFKRNQSLEWQPEIYRVTGNPEVEKWWKAKPLGGRVSYHAQLTLKNELVGLDGFYADFKAFAASLGFTHLASFAWDLIPFSFLFNWIAPVDKWLDRYATIQPFAGELRVVQSGHSISSNFAWNIFFHPSANYGNPEQYLGRLIYRSYDRRTGLPVDSGPLLSDADLLVSQQAIIAALIAQRAPS
jgi:hypothetical protein